MKALPRRPSCGRLGTVKRLLVRLVLLAAVATAVTACATPSDGTWIHPDTGSVPPRAAPQGG